MRDLLTELLTLGIVLFGFSFMFKGKPRKHTVRYRGIYGNTYYKREGNLTQKTLSFIIIISLGFLLLESI